MNAIDVVINGQAQRLEQTTQLAQWIQQRYGDRRNLAVALNGWVVNRADWASTELQAGDQLDVFAAVAGG